MTAVIIIVSLVVLVIIYSSISSSNRRNKIEKVTNLKNSYPEAFSKYIREKRIRQTAISNLDNKVLNTILNVPLQYWRDEEKKIQTEREKRKKINEDYNKLESKYPNGIKTWISIHATTRNSYSSLTGRNRILYDSEKEKAIKSETEIASLEKAYTESAFYSEWETEQKTFTDLCRDKRDTYLSYFGCYSYKPKFEKINRKGEKVNGEYVVWQFFPYSFCLEKDLDYSLKPTITDNTEAIEKHRFYCDEEDADNIINFILSLSENEGDVCVLFRDARNRWNNTDLISKYSFIYKKLEKKISSYSIYINENILSRYDSNSDGSYNNWLKNIRQKIVIIDYATENHELIDFCGNLIVDAKKKKPLIAYISLMKGYNRAEMQKILDEKKKEEEEKAKILQKRRQIEEASSNSWPLVKGIHHYFFYYYYPTRFDDVSDQDQRVRRLIWNFKDGIRYTEVCDILVEKLKQTYGDALDMLTFVCIPASTKDVNESRYEDFMESVCEKTKMRNGYSHITITKEKEPTHLGGETSAEYSYDKDFFKDSLVIIFDDVVTRGRSLAKMKSELQNNGATVIAALSIGRTYSDYYGDNRQPHPWTGTY